VTVADASFAGPDRPVARQAVLWVAAAAVAVMAHGGVVLVALRQPPPTPAEDSAPPAITIDLAPMPVAPQATEERIAPDTTDAPAVDASAPDRMPVPAPPPPTVVPTIAPQQVAERAPLPDPLAPQKVDTLPQTQPEVTLPQPEATETRPLSRPENLRVVEVPDPVKTAEPAPPSPAAAWAQVRTDQAEAVAAPRSSAGTRGMSPAKWQAKLMAHLERYKLYPPAARQRREEGVVKVRFVIDDGGNVRSAQLVRSSGHADLDEAVLTLVRRASPVPAPPPGAPRDIVAPVQFNVR